jgi:hypothetical protein
MCQVAHNLSSRIFLLFAASPPQLVGKKAKRACPLSEPPRAVQLHVGGDLRRAAKVPVLWSRLRGEGRRGREEQLRPERSVAEADGESLQNPAGSYAPEYLRCMRCNAARSKPSKYSRTASACSACSGVATTRMVCIRRGLRLA